MIYFLNKLRRIKEDVEKIIKIENICKFSFGQLSDISNQRNMKNNQFNKNSVNDNRNNIRIEPFNNGKKIGIYKSKKEETKEKLNKKNIKIILNDKGKIIFSKFKKEPHEVLRKLLLKIYLNIWKDRKNQWEKKYIKIKKNQKHLLLKNLMIDIIDKIRKEAKRRTLIKAFRDINELKYPILYYSLLKIKKFSIVKFNVMNAFAALIQKNYKNFKQKKEKFANNFI